MKSAATRMFVVLIVSVVCTSAQAGTLPKTAKLVPPETVLLVDIDDFAQFKTQFEKTTSYKLYKDPAMRAFVKDAKAKVRKKVNEADENDILRMFLNTESLPQGRVAVALVLNEQAKTAKAPPLVAITQWGAKIDKVRDAVKELLKKNVELGGRNKRSEDYRGVKIGIAVDEEDTPFNHCFIDDCFIISTNIDLIKFIIAHLKGASSPTLAGDNDYAATMKAVGPYHDVDLYVNIKQLVKMAISEDTTPKTRTMMANLGFDNAASVGCSAGFAREPGSSWSGKVFVKINGPKKGICKMLDVESSAIRPPRFIPGSACSAMFANLDVKKAFGELANILRILSPQAAAIMYMPLIPPSPQGEPGIQLKRDVIDHFGSQIVIARGINKPFSMDVPPTETFIALAVSNTKALEKSLSVLHSKLLAANNPDAKRELLGHTIYQLSIPLFNLLAGSRTPMQSPSAPNPPQMPTFAFTVTDSHLILGVESTVERAIRTLSSSEDTSMVSAKWFTTAKSALPSVVGLATMEDNAVAGELFWWLMKQGKKTLWGPNIQPDVGSPSLSLGPMQVAELFDFSLLPEFDAVRKYFGLSVSYGVSRPGGFFFEFKYLDPSPAE
ncbi:MAG: hypothetical protein ACYS8I_05355 [Planctomycetota bacterium]|jgi:hypothetical protein